MVKYVLLFSLVFILFFCSSNKPYADSIYYNALFYTMSQNNEEVSVVAVKDGKIIFTGNEIPQNLKNQNTNEIDLQGKCVVPGFIDSHLHFMDGGYSLSRIDLRNVSSQEDFIEKISEYANKLPRGTWILGGNWDHTLWKGHTLPTRWWIDKVTPNNPVFINRLDGHMALANTLAIKKAKITNNVKTPPGGVVVRDKKNRLTGIFKESAKYLISKAIPRNDFATRKMAAKAAVSHLLSQGITSVHDMGLWEHLTVYDSLLSDGDLKVRISLFPPIGEWNRAKKMKLKNTDTGFLQVKGFKGFMDGSLGSLTAKFFKPYLNQPENTGVWDVQMIPPDKMMGRIKKADELGYQVVIHAIGTEANSKLLSMYKQVMDTRTRKTEQRFRIEHAQHLKPEDIGKFAEYGIIPAMQPYHCIDDGRWAETKIGYERCKTTYAFRDLIDSGALPAFGSDWDVAPVSPLWGIYAAVTRRTLDGKNPDGWVPEQKISVEEAVRCYTVNAAYSDFSENIKGSLELGKYADFVILSDNIFETDPINIKGIEIEKTVVNGKIVYNNN